MKSFNLIAVACLLFPWTQAKAQELTIEADYAVYAPSGTRAPESNRMLVGYVAGGSFGAMRGYVSFDLSSVPEGASITGVSLSLFARVNPFGANLMTMD